MSPLSDDFEGLVGVLQEELPTSFDRERVRARLESAGVLVAGSALLAARLSEGLSGGVGLAPLAPKASLLAKLATLSATSKALVAVSLASVLALPVVWPSTPSEAGAMPTTSKSSTSSLDLRVAASKAPEKRGDVLSEPLEAEVVRDVSSPVATEPNSGPMEQSFHESSAGLAAPRLSSHATVLPSSKRPPESARTDAKAFNPPPEVSPLREETALIEQALAALRRGDRALARAFLESHRERFPNGALAPERRQTLERLALDSDP